jgi:hypothetical protein
MKQAGLAYLLLIRLHDQSNLKADFDYLPLGPYTYYYNELIQSLARVPNAMLRAAISIS